MWVLSIFSKKINSEGHSLRSGKDYLKKIIFLNLMAVFLLHKAYSYTIMVGMTRGTSKWKKKRKKKMSFGNGLKL